MKIADWIHDRSTLLKKRGIETARLDCLVLLEDLFGKDKAWILANDDKTIPSPEVGKLDELIKKRSTHTPLAFLRGRSEFYRREFFVDFNTLIPRPESEEIINQRLKYAPHKSVLDIGTGSGCLAISAALELNDTPVYGIDVSEKCIKVALLNKSKHKAEAIFKTGDLLSSIDGKIVEGATILANLPYVPNNIEINKEAEHEPAIAIFGGKDGLSLYRRLFDQIIAGNSRPRMIITESLEFQHEELNNIASTHNYKLVDSVGLVQVFMATAPAQA